MRSIRNQLLIYLVPGVLLLAGGVGVGLYTYMEEVLEHGLDAALAAKAQAIAGAVHMEDDGQPQLQLSATAASAGARHEGPYFFQVWRGDGRTLARVTPMDSDLALPRNRNRRFYDQRLADGTSARGTVLFFAAVPDEDASEPGAHPPAPPLERLRLVVAHDRHSIDGPLAILLSGLSVGAVGVAGGIVAVVTWGVRRALRPLDEVSAASDKIGPESMELRLPSADRLPAELQPIGQKLNDLLDRLASGFSRERQFSAAVAHELRTPLAELRTCCEVALGWPDDRSGSASAALTDSLGIAREMGAMVENLLALARGQSCAEIARPQDVPLLAAVRRIWSRAEPIAIRRSLTVELNIDSATQVRVDPDMLAAILGNLLENAAVHASVGGQIQIESTQLTPTTVAMQVGNSCDELTNADLSRVFEPFWQKSTSRTGGDHVGLGLCLAENYCRATGATISVSLDGPHWFRVTLVLPGATAGGTPATPA
jgi:signal transduction histidine kinase